MTPIFGVARTSAFAVALSVIVSHAQPVAAGGVGCAELAIHPELCLAFVEAAHARALADVLDAVRRQIGAQAADGSRRREPADVEARRAALATSQTAWLAYRDAQCRAKGGDASALHACRSALAKERLDEMNDPDLPRPGVVDASWSKNRISADPWYTSSTQIMGIGIGGNGWFPPMRTLADRTALAGPPETAKDWACKKWVPELKETLRQRGRFGPVTASFIAEEWDSLRFNPETGERLHDSPDVNDQSPANRSFDRDEKGDFADRLPACLRNMSAPTCRVRYSTELGCHYDDEMAMREMFKGFKALSPDHRDRVYEAIACLVEKRPANPLEGTFVASKSWPNDGDLATKAGPSIAIPAGGACAGLGLRREGGGWIARQVPVFGRTVDLEISPMRGQ